jgi:hypothetical protein
MSPRETGWLVTLGILSLCVFSYWVGVLNGTIQCEHRCYWCWASLEANRD